LIYNKVILVKIDVLWTSWHTVLSINLIKLEYIFRSNKYATELHLSMRKYHEIYKT